MEAAEAIGDWLREGKHDPASIDVVNEKVAAIFEACSFQDVTGQRIRRAIQHLQQVETMLTDMVPADMGAPAADQARGQRAVHQPRRGQRRGIQGESGSGTGCGGFALRVSA